MSERELVNLAPGDLIGVHETIVKQVANVTYPLLTNPDLRHTSELSRHRSMPESDAYWSISVSSSWVKSRRASAPRFSSR